MASHAALERPTAEQVRDDKSAKLKARRLARDETDRDAAQAAQGHSRGAEARAVVGPR